MSYILQLMSSLFIRFLIARRWLVPQPKS